jgi:hypothetical protein
LLEKAVILSWHVSYWDYLGWKDRFAKKEFTDRQRNYVAAGKVRGLVTPQFMLDNAPIEGGSDVPKRIDRASATPADFELQGSAKIVAGKIDLTIGLKKVSALAALKPSARILPLLVLNRAMTKPLAGENRGTALVERFIVMDSAPPVKAADALAGALTAHIDMPKTFVTADLRVVLLLEDPETVTTLECVSVKVSSK